MTGYFEVISASAPHIYHSALVLAPQTSIVQKLYQSHIYPFVRFVHGAPVSWDPHIAATTFPTSITSVVWSPCSSFVAVALSYTQMVVVLDSVTLQRLHTLKLPQDTYDVAKALVFSPDSCVLTCFSHGYTNEGSERGNTVLLVSWDLQTGGVASIIRWPIAGGCYVQYPSITYSVDGKLVGISYCQYGAIAAASVSICNITSGVYTHFPLLDSDIILSHNIWTHGESLQFATADATAIIIWEVGFISSGTPTQVETLPVPDNFDPESAHVQFLPTPYLLSLTFSGRVLVWDVRNSRYLLDWTNIGFHLKTTFSSNGHFLACTTLGKIYLWKKSPTGYILHIIPAPNAVGFSEPLFSQNGESMAVYCDHTIWFWHTNSFTTHPSSILTQDLPSFGDFILNFSPDGILAVMARKNSNTAMVLNLKSGVPQLTISVDVSVCGLGVTENTVFVMGDWKVIAWDLPAEGYARVGLEDSSWITNLEDMAVTLGGSQGKREWSGSMVYGASIAPDSCCIALTVLGVLTEEKTETHSKYLCIYCASTGECLGHEKINTFHAPWFAPDGCDIWCVGSRNEVGVWRAGGEDVLKHLGQTVDPEHPPEGYPWASSHGYQLTDDWWILSPDRRRLLMLPPLWHSHALQGVWKGQLLALLCGELSEPVILELDP